MRHKISANPATTSVSERPVSPPPFLVAISICRAAESHHYQRMVTLAQEKNWVCVLRSPALGFQQLTSARRQSSSDASATNSRARATRALTGTGDYNRRPRKGPVRVRGEGVRRGDKQRHPPGPVVMPGGGAEHHQPPAHAHLQRPSQENQGVPLSSVELPPGPQRAAGGRGPFADPLPGVVRRVRRSERWRWLVPSRPRQGQQQDQRCKGRRSHRLKESVR